MRAGKKGAENVLCFLGLSEVELISLTGPLMLLYPLKEGAACVALRPDREMFGSAGGSGKPVVCLCFCKAFVYFPALVKKTKTPACLCDASLHAAL